MPTYKYWTHHDRLLSLIEDESLIKEPLPDGYGVWSNDSLLPGYPDEYKLLGGKAVRREPLPPPTLLERPLSLDKGVIAGLDTLRKGNPVAACLCQLLLAKLESNLKDAEAAHKALAVAVAEASKNQAPLPTPVVTK